MAVETGDSMTVRILLSASLLRVGVNQIICRLSSGSYTGLERAARLGHRGVVKVLLDHGADVSLDYRSD